MSLALLFRAFALVFLAELGDKTQLTTLALASSETAGQRPALSLFLGSALALVCTSAIAAFAGAWISRHIPPAYVRIGSAVLFFVFGVILLREAIADFKA